MKFLPGGEWRRSNNKINVNLVFSLKFIPVTDGLTTSIYWSISLRRFIFIFQGVLSLLGA